MQNKKTHFNRRISHNLLQVIAIIQSGIESEYMTQILTVRIYRPATEPKAKEPKQPKSEPVRGA